jgi:hypothetical protein
MSSQLETIYTNLAGQAVTADSKTATVYSLGSLMESVESAELPCRLLLPISPSIEGKQGAFGGLGNGPVRVTWNLTDLLLWSEAGLGTGMAMFAASLIRYMVAYVDMLKGFRNLGAGMVGAEIKGWTLTPGMFEWPRGSNRWFAGVECSLEILEVI